MKKLTYILAGLIMAVAIVSCEKNDKQLDKDLGMMKAAEINYSPDGPIISGENPNLTCLEDVAPQIIPPATGDKDRGGNRTCEAVDEWLGLGDDYLCGDKNDYNDGSFEKQWPAGLTVNVDGIYIDFEVDDCIAMDEWIDGKLVTTYWKVGAVIVKGSNAANIYHYGPEGTTKDCNLFAPGEKPMVSNLTFCFVPCKPTEERVISIKVWYEWKDGDGEVWTGWAASAGTSYPYSALDPSTYWCTVLGVNAYPTVTSIDMMGLGTATIAPGSATITLDNSDMSIISTHIYVGTEAGMGDKTQCPEYTVNPPWMQFMNTGNPVTVTW